jgi:hypothetical protein
VEEDFHASRPVASARSRVQVGGEAVRREFSLKGSAGGSGDIPARERVGSRLTDWASKVESAGAGCRPPGGPEASDLVRIGLPVRVLSRRGGARVRTNRYRRHAVGFRAGVRCPGGNSPECRSVALEEVDNGSHQDVGSSRSCTSCSGLRACLGAGRDGRAGDAGGATERGADACRRAGRRRGAARRPDAQG